MRTDESGFTHYLSIALQIYRILLSSIGLVVLARLVELLTALTTYVEGLSK